MRATPKRHKLLIPLDRRPKPSIDSGSVTREEMQAFDSARNADLSNKGSEGRRSPFDRRSVQVTLYDNSQQHTPWNVK